MTELNTRRKTVVYVYVCVCACARMHLTKLFLRPNCLIHWVISSIILKKRLLQEIQTDAWKKSPSG